MAGFAWIIVRVVSNIKVKVINPLNERLDKPAIIICNHHSFFDLLATVMLFPKCVLLTNDWVWNSPVFGAVVRMADYFPVTEGAINSINHLQECVKNGYSILIFPEGTRSPDATIKRFHKGAFYLSEQLQIDIIPLLIHGTSYVMGKGEYQFKRGEITLQYLPRISPQDSTFGATYTERAKLVGRYFRAEYDVLKRKVEQPEYFGELLLSNYIYKGPILEWYMRVKVKLEDSYRLFHQHLPLQGKILDVGCGYGFMAYMLKYLSPQREIYGIDYDESKTDLAQHNYTRPPGLEFAHADITTFAFTKYDGIVIADVLHYLRPEEQKQTIIHCFDSLNPGGIMMIRDGNKDLVKRHKGTKLTEFLSTKVFSFNKTTTSGLSFLSGAMIHELATKYQLACEELDNSSLTSNIVFIIKKPTGQHEAKI
jgi:1-acyl-sn-glycerol-3-phosphate acyltransferase